MMRGYYLVITIVVLLDIAKCSVIGTGYFRNGKFWKQIGPPVRSIDEKWIEQKLDHFDSKEIRTWKQRYFVNEKILNNDRNVAFLNIGGEGSVELSQVDSGAWYSYGQKFRPIFFSLEHRYYGVSRPTENISTENLKYLSSKQALADLAFFIETMNKQYNLSPKVKWIVFGCSYAGSLAAWARLLYPNLVHGAVSSSGPLLAKADFYEYYMVVEDALRTKNERCPDVIQEGYKQLEELLNDAENRYQINEIFNLCDDIESQIDKPLNLAALFFEIALRFADDAQYNTDHDSSMDDHCHLLLNEGLGSALNRLAAVLRSGSSSCTNIDYNADIEQQKLDKWDSFGSFGQRQWFYQTCTEFGYYQTSSQDSHVFGNRFDVDFFIHQCKDIHGPKFNKTFVENAIAATNDLYQGLDINVTNTVFIHGSLDPWHPLGIYKTRSENAPAILLDGASHCTDVFSPSSSDSPQLKAAQAKIKELISQWLKN